MEIQYEFYESPEREDGKEVSYHVRPVTFGTVDTDKLIYDIHERSSLAVGDVKSALTGLGESLAKYLNAGSRVHLDGIGYFQITLSCPKDAHPAKTKANEVKFKSIRFQADWKLKGQLQDLKAKRSLLRRHSAPLTNQEVDDLVNKHFEETPVLTRREVEKICSLTRVTAGRHITRLIKEGKIKNINSRYQPIYMKVEKR